MDGLVSYRKILLTFLALHLAALEKHIEIMELLLKDASINVNTLSNDKNTVLHYFVRGAFTSMEQPSANRIMQTLLKRGVPIDAQNEVGESAIFLAIIKGI